MKKVFIDTNIILDLLGERKPFYDSAAKIATLADQKKIILVVSPISFATISYVLAKFENNLTVINKLRKFKIICEICIIDESIIEKGLNFTFKDFEDALQYFSAIDANCEIIITRNGKDFKKSLIPVMSPDEFLNSIQNIF